ncbi:NADP-dependent oxidoreductase domain-containing protein [Cyathus striatus]|nr:NADP-dependent oxidoreductase domain-containing protein [Cyathus striatus]
MSLFTPPPEPPSKLGRYRLLSPTAGVHVSPLQLGAASIGDKWGGIGWGATSKEDSFKLLDTFFDNGGNFIDTANLYQDETSEMFIGEWAEKRGIRDQLFIASKYSANHKKPNPSIQQKIMYAGNNAKSLHISLHESLKKLRTNYIDLYYIHFWDFDTSVEEIMRGLHTVVLQGKGVSDTPAWVVSKANQYARDHALTPFSVYQGAWNLLERSFEREIIPMARDQGMALAPWNVLAGGKLRSDAEEGRRRQNGEIGRTFTSPNWERNKSEKEVARTLEKVAHEVGTKHSTSVAIAYLLHKTTYVFPIMGGGKVEQLLANTEALDISLSKEQIDFLESVLPFNPGFPHYMIVRKWSCLPTDIFCEWSYG